MKLTKYLEVKEFRRSKLYDGVEVEKENGEIKQIPLEKIKEFNELPQDLDRFNWFKNICQ